MSAEVPKPEQQTEFKSLYRVLPIPVKDNWETVEKMVAARLGVFLGTKHETPGAWASVYEWLGQHFMQMTDQEWRNF